MSITLILAVSENGVIGKDNTLPWKLPNDMKRFRELTVGKIVVMGRKTWDSLPASYRPLPDRVNWVLSRDPDFKPESCLIFNDSHDIIHKTDRSTEIIVIGGAEIYRQFLLFADKIEMTLVRANFEGDAHFTDFLKPNWDIGWEMTHRREFVPDDKHAVPYAFITYQRRK